MNQTIAYLTLVSLFCVGGCESNQNTLTGGPSGLQSGSSLQPGSTAGFEGTDYSYIDRTADLSQYSSVILDPVTVYRGPEAHFEDLNEAKVSSYAQTLGTAFQDALREAKLRAIVPSPSTVRLKVTLIGVSPTVGGAATVTRVAPVGAIANVVKMQQGDPGALTGGIQYSVEAFDSRTGKLVAAAIRRVSPPVFDMESTLSTDATVRSASREAAQLTLSTMEKVIRSRK